MISSILTSLKAIFSFQGKREFLKPTFRTSIDHTMTLICVI